jgi:hypothetical protein
MVGVLGAALLAGGAGCNRNGSDDGGAREAGVSARDDAALGSADSGTHGGTDGVVDDKTDVVDELGAAGFRLTAGEVVPDAGPRDGGSVRFALTVVGTELEAVYGATLTVHRVQASEDAAAGQGAADQPDDMKRNNLATNIFTLVANAGYTYELALEAPGYASTRRALRIDHGGAAERALTFVLRPQKSDAPAAAEGAPAGEAPSAPAWTQLPRCNATAGDRAIDLAGLIESLRVASPDDAAALKKIVAGGAELKDCDADAFPVVRLRLATPTGEAVSYEIADATQLAGGQGVPRVPTDVSLDKLFERGGRGAYELQGQYNADTFWFELDKDLSYLALHTGKEEAHQFFRQKDNGGEVIDAFLKLARTTLKLTPASDYDEARCYASGEAMGIAFYDISNDPTKEKPTADVAYVGDGELGGPFATGDLAGCHRLDLESLKAFVAKVATLLQ